MGMLGFSSRKNRPEATAPEWERPAAHTGLGYSSEDAAAALARLEQPVTPDLLARVFAADHHLYESVTDPAVDPTAALRAVHERLDANATDDQLPTVAWTTSPPQRSGLYWHAPHAGDIEALETLVVLKDYVRIRRPGSDSVLWRSVKLMGGWWAGPIAVPEGVELEDLG